VRRDLGVESIAEKTTKFPHTLQKRSIGEKDVPLRDGKGGDYWATAVSANSAAISGVA
jgi:hypothetical protein